MFGIDRISFKRSSLPVAISTGVLLLVPVGLAAPSLAQNICPPQTSTQQRQNSYRPVSESNAIPNRTAPNNDLNSVVQPPLPESQMKAAANVGLTGGKVDVTLKNNTNTPITYQVIGNTPPRTLLGRQEVVLRNLPAPVTIPMYREDGGLLTVTPQASDRSGTLEVTLDESSNFNSQQSALTIDNEGRVLLN